MTHALLALENEYWQAGILPGTGGSVASGRVWNGAAWVDALRPTAEADYGNPSSCASFVMLPWCNRIGGGRLTFGGVTHQLATAPDDGTARHGDVRKRAFEMVEATPQRVRLTLDSRTQADVNWPWAFRADLTYRLDGRAFVWEIALTNLDTTPFPAGFGHHPYFVRPPDSPLVEIPCSQYFPLTNSLATGAPQHVPDHLDYRTMRPLPDDSVDDVLTGCADGEPVRLRFPDRGVALTITADPIFAHWLLYAPKGWPSFAVEPMTNVNDGFALAGRGVGGTGVFVLEPGQTARGVVTLTTVDA